METFPVVALLLQGGRGLRRAEPPGEECPQWSIADPQRAVSQVSGCPLAPRATDRAASVVEPMRGTLHSILTRLVAYVAVVIAVALLFLAGASVYELMWPRPVVPFAQMSR